MRWLFINSQPDLSFYTKRGLNIEVEYDVCNKVFSAIKSGVSTTPDGKSVSLYSPDVYEYLDKTYKKKYDLTFFTWKPEDYGQEFAYTGGQTFSKKLSNGSYFATIRKGTPNAEIHEGMHMIGKILYNDLKKYDAVDQMDATLLPDGTTKYYYKNDTPEAPDGNFAVTWNSYKKYLPELNNTMPKYKYFTEKEIVGLKPEFVQILDKARELAGTPFVIASGFRTLEQNKKAGGVPNSAHLKGLAVDLQCTDNAKRTKILRGLYNCGHPLFIEVAGRHLHVDIDSSIHPLDTTIWGNDPT